MGREIDNLVDSWSNEDNFFEPAVQSTTYVEKDPTKQGGMPSPGGDIVEGIMRVGTEGLVSLLEVLDSGSINELVSGEDIHVSWKEDVQEVGVGSVFKPVIKYLKAGLKKVSKSSKKPKEDMVKMYRGVDKWHPNLMVKEGRFIGGTGQPTKMSLLYKQDDFDLWATQSKGIAKMHAEKMGTKGIVLEFEVPKSYMLKNFTSSNPYSLSLGRKVVESEGYKMFDLPEIGVFLRGIPKEFLKKVHK